jgi:hypothetical protein
MENARRTLKRKPELKWWLVYGPPRCGTTHMLRMVKACAILYVSDWGLAPILEPIPEWMSYYSSPDFDYIKFDYDRFVKSISDNILDNAFPGTGVQLDFAYKQATLGLSEYQTLVNMWGPPARIIFCMREPSGYMASAIGKFTYETLETLRQTYIRSMSAYLVIGGDVFEYTPDLGVEDYISFLEPLDFEGKWIPPFEFKGEQDHKNATEEMWEAYYGTKELALS